MKTGKAVFGWVIVASLFVAAGTMFAPKMASYRTRRILGKVKRLLGIQDALVTGTHDSKDAFAGLL